MLTRSSIRLIVTVVASVLMLIPMSSSVWADDDFSSENIHSQARYQVGLKVAYRIDDTRYHDYTPSAGARFLYYPADWMAFTVGFQYNSHGEISDRASYRSMVIDFSWRFQARNEIFLNSLPYVEIGPVAPRYWVTNNGQEFTETQAGWRLATGFSIPLGKTKTVDLSVSQVLNHFNNQVFTMTPQLAPCPLGIDCDDFRYIPDGVYNETNLEMTFRIGL